MSTQTLPPKMLSTTMNYHLEAARGGEEVWCPGTVRDKRRPHDHQEVTVEDIRGREAEFTTDTHGFHVGSFAPSQNDYEVDADFKGVYYQECAEHIKKM